MMTFLDWFENNTTIERRMQRGIKAFHFLANPEFWQGCVAMFLLVTFSPVWITIYLTGCIAEWRDNCRDGVKSVRA